MTISEISAKSILRTRKTIDSWFIARAGMNLYRGCQHNCSYCDGRAERYQVDGIFGEDVAVKTNALEILRRELNPRRKHRPLTGFILMGGGVGDSYQPAEDRYQLARRVLVLLRSYRYPVHILTKSTLVKRDIDIIGDIHDQRGALVSSSFSSVDDDISAIFEPHVPPPSERLALLEQFRKAGIPVGMFLLPVIPCITDGYETIEASIRAARDIGADFVIGGVMTLKPGQQQDHFLHVLEKYSSEACTTYHRIYAGDQWGTPSSECSLKVNERFYRAAAHHRMPKRVPPHLWAHLVTENEKVAIVLDHLDYLARLRGKPSSYAQAARSIHALPTSIGAYSGALTDLAGIGPTTANIIQEIIETGTCAYYTSLLTD